MKEYISFIHLQATGLYEDKEGTSTGPSGKANWWSRTKDVGSNKHMESDN